MTDKNLHDPHATREASNYTNPIASRELILGFLKQNTGPMTRHAIAQKLEYVDDDQLEALRRRLRAMERDGQIISNRRGAYGPVDKMNLVRGRVQGHRDGYGFVIPSEGGDDIYIMPRQMRRVFDGDEVLVRLTKSSNRGKKEGSIVEVLVHNTTELVGRFVDEKGVCTVRPDNARITQDIVVLKEETLAAQPGQIVLVEITQQPGKSGWPQGRISQVLGDHLAPGMEIDVAIRAHGIPHIWPPEVSHEADLLSEEVIEGDKKHRVDLRDLPLVTIDGEDARDFDDAVYCEKKKSGGWRVYVAIADVSHYVSVGSALDQEAFKRATSVYFPDFVVPMLPEALSNGLCSLNPAVDRLCMVCEMTVSAAGKVSGYQFYEGLMHSHARLTYTQVGQMLAEKDNKKSGIRKQFNHIVSHIDELHNLYHVLRATRSTRGAIDFETQETRILFDENRKISRIIPVQRNDAHKLIEECMLAANVCAARFLETHGLPALYRVHESPKAQKLELLREYLQDLGLHLGKGKIGPQHYQAVMQAIKDRSDAHIIQTVMLRSMNQAVYQPDNNGHFGLAYTAYAHFTSPIRRYPDLLVHRAIRNVIRSKQDSQRVKRVTGAKRLAKAAIYPYDFQAMLSLGEHCSMTERRADDATRDVVNWLKCEYLSDQVGKEFEGIISSVTSFGLFVELKEFFVEGLVHVTALPQDYYRHDAARHRMLGERTRRAFQLGDELVVRVINVDLDERKIDFELAEKKPKIRKRASAKDGVTVAIQTDDVKKESPAKKSAKKSKKKSVNKTALSKSKASPAKKVKAKTVKVKPAKAKPKLSKKR